MSFKSVYKRWSVFHPIEKATSVLLVLPGRSLAADNLASFYSNFGLKSTLIVGITPVNYEWYPQPNGPFDQQDALSGIQPAVNTINWAIGEIIDEFGIAEERIAMAGYSAGAVMTIQTIAKSGRKLAAGCCHAGAILDPDELPVCETETPLMVIHAIDDSTFDWPERYLPMKEALVNKGYNASFAERKWGGHGISWRDLMLTCSFMAPKLGYAEDFHSIYGDAWKEAQRGTDFSCSSDYF